MRTAFICVTVTVTSPLERIYISAGVTRRPFGFQPKGWCLSRSRNGSAHFRRYFAMGKIRGTPCGPEFKSRRPDQNILRVFFSLTKDYFTQN